MKLKIDRESDALYFRLDDDAECMLKLAGITG
jgi:hypothetical protein